MSNILIIKHGSLGDIAQASGAIQDIYDNHKDDFIYLLTSHIYSDLFKKNPNIKEVIVDKRLSRFNLIYLFSLMKKIKQHKFTKVYDLQNSSRTSFYKRILFPNLGSYKWSSSETTLPANETKKEFDKKPVLERFDHQLKISGLKTSHTLKPDFSWGCSNIDKLISKYNFTNFDIVMVTLSIGAGSMMISHVNDSYFWIVSKKSEMNLQNSLKYFSIMTVFQSLSTILFISLIILIST